jgi:hypothetical protein
LNAPLHTDRITVIEELKSRGETGYRAKQFGVENLFEKLVDEDMKNCSQQG